MKGLNKWVSRVYDAVSNKPAGLPILAVNDLPSASSGYAQQNYSYFDGEKYPGGFGDTQIYTTDYWTLRQRSAQIFKENLYGRGIIRRLVTNEITTGLTLDSTPKSEFIPIFDEDQAAEWAENMEDRWGMFAADKRVCDYQKTHTEGELQSIIRQESLVDGDILVVQRFNNRTKTSGTQLIRGEFVRSPNASNNALNGNLIRHGVETDASGRHVAYWVKQESDDDFVRLPAFGPKTGRPTAWLVYGTDRRFGDVRGEPLLSIVMQSLKEIDRYRDSTQRKAVINSILAMYITKTQDKMGTKPVANGSVRRQSVSTPTTDAPNRALNLNGMIPGVVFDELQQGEEPKAFRPDGTDINFREFEAAIIQAIAWAFEMPGEILTLQFTKNYSASQAAINEFKMYLNVARTKFASQYCRPRYDIWLFNEIVAGRVEAPGLLEIWNDPSKYVESGAWKSSDWTGAIKPSTDVVKQTRGYVGQIEQGLITREKASRELNGTSFLQNVRRAKRENEKLAEALAPLQALQSTEANALPAIEFAEAVATSITEAAAEKDA